MTSSHVRGGEVGGFYEAIINLKGSDKHMKKLIPAGLIVLVGIITVFSAGCVNNPANPTTYPSAIDDFSVKIDRIWSTDSLGYYVGCTDSDLSHQEEYKAGEGWKFIVLDMHVYNMANETRIFRYPHIVDEAGVEYYPVILEGDAGFSYYHDDEDLSEKYGWGYWRRGSPLLDSGKSSLRLTTKLFWGRWGRSRDITIVYKIPINERPVKFYYQICDSDGMLLSIASKDL